MKTKSLLITTAAIVVLIAAVIVIGIFQTNSANSQTPNENVTLVVNLFNSSKSFSYKFQNITALALLEENNTVNVTNSKYGAFVNCINSVCSDNNYYWMYYINNKSADVGASSYYIKGNDTIEFKYEKASL